MPSSRTSTPRIDRSRDADQASAEPDEKGSASTRGSPNSSRGATSDMHGTNLQGRDSTSLRHARFIFIYLRIYNCCVLVYFINYSHNLNLNLNL